MHPKRTPASWRSRPRKRNAEGPPPKRRGPFAEFGGGGGSCTRAGVDEVAALFDSLPPYDPYCYEDAKSGGWSMDYDILVMVG